MLPLEASDTPADDTALDASDSGSAPDDLSSEENLRGALALTRLIGPGAYGLYASAYAITTFVVALARFGIEATLIGKWIPSTGQTLSTSDATTM